MKKLLIGTTALVAVGMAADGAFAAEKIKLGLGGYWRGFAVVSDQDNLVTGKRDGGLAREGEIYFAGETTLDNGLRVGANVQLEAETSTDQIDNSSIYFAGGFGRVIIGSFWGPGVAMHYEAPGNNISGHGNFPAQNQVNTVGTNAAASYYSTYVSLAANYDQIAYYTPRVAGFQLGVGYAPDNGEELGYANRSDSDGGVSEIWLVGANYQGKFNDVGVNVSGTYAKGNREPGGASSGNPSEWNLGANVTFGAFAVGASYKREDSGTPGSSSTPSTWEIGANYTMGALSVGAIYANEDADNTADEQLRYISVSAAYALGPGVSVMAGIQNYSWDSNTAANDGTSTVYLVGTKLDF